MDQKIKAADREILSVIMDLSKAVRCCRQDEVFCEDVTFTQFNILDAIATNRTLNMANLHDVLSVDKSTTTRLVTPLIRRGLVVRERADHDSRAAVLRLTDEGVSVHAKVWQCLISFVRAIQAEISDGKRDAVLDGIRVFLNALQNVSTMRCAEGVGPGSCKCAATQAKPFSVSGRRSMHD
jgi:DNA-binding MarR family transcriptional regulator